MNRKFFSIAIAGTIALSLLTTSCIGQFAMTSRIYKWNNQIGSKFVNELVFVGLMILPVYPLSGLIDLTIINSIEFWSGTNPMEKSDSSVFSDENGKTYRIDSDRTGYTITNSQDNNIVRFDHDEETDSWSVSVNGGGSYTILSFIDESHVEMIGADGAMHTVALDAEGLLAYQTEAANASSKSLAFAY